MGDAGTDYEAKVLGQANRAIALDADNLRAYLAKAAYLGMSRRFQEALGVTDAELAINPNFVPLYVARAHVENSLGRHEQAKADAERAMGLSPRDPTVGILHVEVGDAEISVGHFDAAIAEYRKALELGPTRVFRSHEPRGRLRACGPAHASSDAAQDHQRPTDLQLIGEVSAAHDAAAGALANLERDIVTDIDLEVLWQLG